MGPSEEQIDAAVNAAMAAHNACRAILDVPREALERGLLRTVIGLRKEQFNAGQLPMPDVAEIQFINRDLNKHFLGDVLLVWLLLEGEAIPVLELGRIVWKYTAKGKKCIDAVAANMPLDFADSAPSTPESNNETP
jgi:hypothetical protein